MSELPLEGLRVLDLSRILAGPFCAMVLGDLGADVIKVERPETGDDTRAWGPPFLPGGESAYFLGVNKDKQSVAVDLARPEGREIVGELIRRSDVVIENFRAGTLERWGFDDAWFAALPKSPIVCTISGYGSSGPKTGAPGYDFILQAETGLMAITGEEAGPPMKLGVAIVDLCTGMMAAIGTLAALQARQRTGRGPRVGVNLHDTGIQLLANVAAGYLATGVDARRYGNGHPNIVPYRTYQASDGWVAVAVGNDRQFDRFAAICDHPEWVEDPRFRSNPDRVRNREVLDDLIAGLVRRRPAADWLAALDADGIAAGPINSVPAAIESEQAGAREIVAQIDHATAGLVRLLRLPIEFDGKLPSIRRPPPTLGQHTEEVLRDALAIGQERIDALRSSGVVG